MAIYDVSYLGTANSKVYFNDYNGDYDNSGNVFRVKNRAPQQRQIRDLDLPIPFESGVSDFETLIGKTAYVIDGTLYPDTNGTSEAGIRALRKVASLDVAQADVLSDSGYVPYVWTETDGNKQVFLKVLYVQLVESARTGLIQDFRLICKVKDPIIFSEDLEEASTAPAYFSAATGTAIFSHTFPLVFGASTSTVSIDAINLGDIAAYPVSIRVYGPVNVPKITNTTTGEYIQVNVNLASTANVLSISYDKDSLRVEADGISIINQVAAASTFWKLEPGSNVISLSGSSVSDDAYAVVSYYSAWPLS